MLRCDTSYDADLHNAGETAFDSAEYSNLYLVFQVEVVLSVLSGIGAVGDICRWSFGCPKREDNSFSALCPDSAHERMRRTLLDSI